MFEPLLIAPLVLIVSPVVQDLELPTPENPYVPPTAVGDPSWETLDPIARGWSAQGLMDLDAFLDGTGTRGFVVLEGGRILIERYYGNWTADRVHPVFSCTKSMVSVLLRDAVQRGELRLRDTMTDWLGAGWSNAQPEDELQISVRDVASMVSGLDDQFHRVTQPGDIWYYNTPVYRELWDVLESASGLPRRDLADERLWTPIGMHATRLQTNGEYALSTARDLARFGLLMLREGRWDRDTRILERAVVRPMLAPLDVNPAYGQLWWRNDGDTFVLPDGTTGAGPLVPSAPDDAFAALGAMDQKVYVVPSLDLVVVRIGANASGPSAVAFDELLWQHLNAR